MLQTHGSLFPSRAAPGARVMPSVPVEALPTEPSTSLPTPTPSDDRPPFAAVTATPPPRVASAMAAPSLPTAAPPSPTPIPTARPTSADAPTSPEVKEWRLEIPAIGLQAKVVIAPLIERNGSYQWQVPWWEVGLAEGTAQPGSSGNVVLLGHVQTINAGNVFQRLHRVEVGDEILLVGGERRYQYVVEDVWETTPTDVSPVAPAREPIVTLITCTGRWLPWKLDFEKRLIVRGHLQSEVGTATPS
ncbi:MAG TPA: sortase [Chloroflexota bacterium]